MQLDHIDTTRVRSEKNWLVMMLAGAAFTFLMYFGVSHLTSSSTAVTQVAQVQAVNEVTSVSQYGVTWEFADAVKAGTFANGDWWVVGPVTVTTITPEFTGTRHGWEVNPDHSRQQGFDDRIHFFKPERVPELPYTANPGESIVKSVSKADGKCRPCLQTAAVLTVLDEVPPDAGQTLFRPGYAGTDKRFYSIQDLKTERLLNLPPVSRAPSFDAVANWFERVQLDHLTNWIGRYMHPEENMPDYGGDIARRTADAGLLFLLEGSEEDKMPALINYVQYGIDLANMREIGTRWPANGGHGPGRKLPLVFAAVLLDDERISEYAKQGGQIFSETGHVHVGKNGIPLFGQDLGEKMYWTRVTEGRGSKDVADPYDYVDGGRGDFGYQFCCTSKPYKAAALAARLLPGAKEVWSHDPFFDYVDRWVEHGVWAKPDPCSFDRPSPFTGECVPGDGRFPDEHGTRKDAGYYGSAFQNQMWSTYRKYAGSMNLPPSVETDFTSEPLPEAYQATGDGSNTYTPPPRRADPPADTDDTEDTSQKPTPPARPDQSAVRNSLPRGVGSTTLLHDKGEDLDNDGVTDDLQQHIATVQSHKDNGRFSAVAKRKAAVFQRLENKTVAEVAADDGHQYPVGLFDFALQTEVGATEEVTFVLDTVYDTSNWVFRKYMNGAYTTLPNVAYDTTEVGNESVTTITYAIRDGGQFDADGTANGVIVDPAGPAIADQEEEEADVTTDETADQEEEETEDTTTPARRSHSNVTTMGEDQTVIPPFTRDISTANPGQNRPNDVRHLSRFLNRFEGEDLILDDEYGRDDVAAVRRFQNKYRSEILDIWNLEEATGYVGITTRLKMNSLLEGQDASCPVFTEFNGGRSGIMTSPEIGRTQELLRELDMYDGPINNRWDSATNQAMIRFQETFREVMLDPWHISAGTGYKYKTTNKFLNYLQGCDTGSVQLEGVGTFDF